MQTIVYHRNAGEDSVIRLVSEANLSLSVVSARVRLEGDSGTGTEIGNVQGEPAGVAFVLPLQIGNLVTGKYQFEIYADYGTTSQKLLFPQPNRKHFIQIQQRFGVDSDSPSNSTFDLTFDQTFS